MISWIRRVIIVWSGEFASLILLSYILPNFKITHWWYALIAVVVISLLNAVLRPLLIKLTLPITVFSLGLFSVGLNALVISIAGYLIPGIEITHPLTPLVITLVLSTVNTLICNLLSLDDENPFYRNIIVKYNQIVKSKNNSGKPGLIILEIDGLSFKSIRKAIEQNYMPNVRNWIHWGSHKLIKWDCGIPSQTSSSQAGILFGDNYDIPGFRWYNKKEKRLIVSTNPLNAAEIEQKIFNNQGLLADNGSGFCNMFSGQASKNVLTLSRINELGKGFQKNMDYFFSYFINPYSFSRALALMTWEMIVHWWEALGKTVIREKPRIRQGFWFPLERAVCTVLLREVAVYTIIEDIFTGVRVNYSTFFGYDVLAHHFGVFTKSTTRFLRILDHQISKLQAAAKQSKFNYKFIILSDHGQSPGISFYKRFGITLEQLVKKYLYSPNILTNSAKFNESRGHLRALIATAWEHDKISSSKLLRKKRKSSYLFSPLPPSPVDPRQIEIVVCTSGNLGLIYFTRFEQRINFEKINEEFPGLIENLALFPGIGFVLVNSDKFGAMVIGEQGINYPDIKQVAGEDPLQDFGNNAAHHLAKMNKYPHTGDIVVNSFIDPSTGEIAPFEEFLGSHGGLGGPQTEPFLIYPRELPLDTSTEIVGSTEIHSILKSWINRNNIEHH
ncbi:MAG: phage holin family protein [bacterium]